MYHHIKITWSIQSSKIFKSKLISTKTHNRILSLLLLSHDLLKRNKARMGKLHVEKLSLPLLHLFDLAEKVSSRTCWSPLYKQVFCLLLWRTLVCVNRKPRWKTSAVLFHFGFMFVKKKKEMTRWDLYLNRFKSFCATPFPWHLFKITC